MRTPRRLGDRGPSFGADGSGSALRHLTLGTATPDVGLRGIMTIGNPYSQYQLAEPVPALARLRGSTMSAAQNPWPHIGQLFVEEGYLTSAQLEAALAEQRRSGERLGEILIERGYITRIHLAGALSKQWSWKGEIPSSIEPPAAPMQLVEESVEPEPVAAAPEFVLVPELPPAGSPHTYPSANRVRWSLRRPLTSKAMPSRNLRRPRSSRRAPSQPNHRFASKPLRRPSAASRIRNASFGTRTHR